ncbi:MAG: NADH-quinone oxidoreductase subunit F, partial [Verrucomicrobiae bacterium]|nr:NADH-quinone oxidoreductase subunit F [Verrucomicrobiae bacterium]
TGMLITDLIYEVAGGIKGGKKLKAVVPGGSSVPILTAEMIEGISMDSDSLRTVGTLLGTGGMCVLDETVDMVKFLLRISKFYDHESCGQCTPCREGSLWMKKITDRLVAGKGAPGDVDTLDSVARNIDGRTICAFGEACSWPTEAFVAKFRDELVADTNPESADAIVNPETQLAAANL